MKNHLCQWVEVRKWKRLSLDVFLGWDPTKNRPKLKTLSYVRYTSNKQKRSLAHGPLRRKWTAERRRKHWKYTATERISYFTQKYPPRSHAVSRWRWRNEKMPPPEQPKAQKDYRWPAATIDGLEKLVFDYFSPNFRGIFFGLWPSGPRWEVSTLQIYSNLIFSSFILTNAHLF